MAQFIDEHTTENGVVHIWSKDEAFLIQFVLVGRARLSQAIADGIHPRILVGFSVTLVSLSFLVYLHWSS